MDFAAIYNVLSQGGIRVVTAAIFSAEQGYPDREITLERGIQVQAEELLEHSVNEVYDIIVLPGGKGSDVMSQSRLLIEMLQCQQKVGRYFGACGTAAGHVLFRHGIVEGPITCDPSLKGKVGDLYQESKVVLSGKCITSEGSSSAMDFGLEIVRLLRGETVAKTVAEVMVMHRF